MNRDIRTKIADWYQENKRDLPWRRTEDPYAIWVSEVMLQQTRVAAAIPYFKRFLERFPDVRALAEADLETVLKVWEGMGYYARARNLHRAARMVVDQYQSRLPADFEELKKLPGIGDYIAAAVSSIAFQKAQPVVDGNVKRVLARLFLCSTPVNSSGAHQKYLALARQFVDEETPESQGTFNQALMELGAMVCAPKNPSCQACPVSDHCLAFRKEATGDFPKREKRKKIPEYHVSAAVLRKNGKILITKRKPEGHLGGLWEFPGGKVRQNETPEEACVREIKEEVDLEIKVESLLARIRHAYTHFKIVMDIYNCVFVSGKVRLDGPVDYRWVRPEELERYPFPGADRKFMDLIVNGSNVE